MSDLPESPILRMEYNGEQVGFHYGNTRMRTFLDSQFDHIEWRDDEGVLKGIRAAQPIMDLLFEHQYPYSFDPIVDEDTVEWFIQLEMCDLEGEIEL